LRAAVAGSSAGIDEAAQKQDSDSDEAKQLQTGKEVDMESDATRGTEKLSDEKNSDDKLSEDDDTKPDTSVQEGGAPDEDSKKTVQKDPVVRDVQSDGADVSVIDPESSDDQEAPADKTDSNAAVQSDEDGATETNPAAPKTDAIEDAEIVSDVGEPLPAKSQQDERAGEAEDQAGDDDRNKEDSQLAKVAASLAQLASAGHRYSARHRPHRRSLQAHNRHRARLLPTRHFAVRATSVLHRRSRVAPAYLRGGYGLTGTAKARGLQRYLRKFGHAHGHAMRSHRARSEVRARHTHRTVAVQPRSFTVHHRRGHRRDEYEY